MKAPLAASLLLLSSSLPVAWAGTDADFAASLSAAPKAETMRAALNAAPESAPAAAPDELGTLAAPSSAGAIRRSSCENERVSVHVRSGKTLRSRDTSLDTSASWTVRGKDYSLGYSYAHAAASTPVPLLMQLVTVNSAVDGGGTRTTTEARVLMVTGSSKVEDFSLHRDNFSERDADGRARMYAWVDGAKGELVTSSVQQRQADGSVRVETRSHGTEVRGGFRDGGSVQTCTIRALSREAWLVLVADPDMAAEIANLDALALQARQAGQALDACRQDCEGPRAALDEQESAFVAAWDALYAGRKAAAQRTVAAERARRARQQARRREQRQSGVEAALAAVRDAERASRENRVLRELQDLREQLERQRR